MACFRIHTSLVKLCATLLIASSCGREDSSGPQPGTRVSPFDSNPLAFQPNEGQAGEGASFIASTPSYTLRLEGNNLVYDVVLNVPDSLIQNPSSTNADLLPADVSSYTNSESAQITLTLIGANQNPYAKAVDQLPGVFNYIIGPDPQSWYIGVKSYKKVEYEKIYPGIDMHFYGIASGSVEHDFIVHPGASPDTIKLGITGANEIRIQENGDLKLSLNQSTGLILKRPYVYQIINGEKHELEGSFIVFEDQTVGYKIGDYDKNIDLVIDPVTLSYSGFVGGTLDDLIFAADVDTSGNVYVTGYARSTGTGGSGFPSPNNTIAGSLSGNNFNAYVIKLNSLGVIQWTTIYGGGSGDTFSSAIKVHSNGDVYLAGYTTSSLIAFGSYSADQTYNGDYDAFIAKLSSSGTLGTCGNSITCYSTYIGGTGFDRISSIAIDSTTSSPACNVAGKPCLLVVGTTTSSTIDAVTAINSNSGSSDAFVARISQNGTSDASKIEVLRFFGGAARDLGVGVGLDSSQNIYISGDTQSSGLSTGGVVDTSLGGIEDSFAAKLNAALSSITYSTYVGGNGRDRNAGIAVYSGSAYLVGTSDSTDLATTNAIQSSPGGGKDLYLAKLNSGATAFTYLTYLGGSADDEASGSQNITVTSTGLAVLTGTTKSSNFFSESTGNLSTAFGFDTKGGASSYPSQLSFPTGATSSGFIMQMGEVDTTNVPVRFASMLGGSTSLTNGACVLVDTAGNLYAVGRTNSTNFPATTGVSDTTLGAEGKYNGFISKLSPLKITFSGTSIAGMASDWTPRYSNLVAYWKLDESSGTSFSDSIGTLTGTLGGTGTTVGATAQIVRGVQFNGSGRITTGSQSVLPTGSNPRTISLWVNTASVSAESYLFVYGNSVSTGNAWGLSIFPGSGDTRTIRNVGWFQDHDVTTTLPNNTWAHIVLTYDTAQKSNIYLNGVLLSSLSRTYNTISNTVFNISASLSDSNRLNGLIDDIAVWNVALTDEEVRVLYARQGGTYTSRVLDAVSAIAWSNFNWLIGYPQGKELTDSPFSEESTLMTSSSALYHFNGTIGAISNGATISDTSGSSRTLTVNGTGASYASGGLLGNAGVDLNNVYFSGNSTGLASGTSSRTVSVWVKPASASNGTIMHYGSRTTSNSFGLFLVSSGSALTVRNFGWGNDHDTTTTIPAGSWTHLAASYDGTNSRIYINGVLNSTLAKSWNTTGLGAGNLTVGSINDTTQRFTGQIDELAMWNRLLSDSEIADLYRRGLSDLKIQSRLCDDSACSGESWSSSYANDMILNGSILPQSTADTYTTTSLSGTNRYFQYRAFINNATTNSAKKELLSIGAK